MRVKGGGGGLLGVLGPGPRADTRLGGLGRRPGVPPADPVTRPVLGPRSRPGAAALRPAALRDLLGGATDAVRDAAAALRARVVPAGPPTVSFAGSGGSTAALTGVALRRTLGAPSVLAASFRVNTGTTTERSSTAALGLDTTTAESASELAATGEANTTVSTVRTSAGALGLDTTTAESASVLRATAEINTATSTVRSSTTTVGLDATTAEAASTLTSTAEANTAATSYAKVRLAFGSSTTAASLSGVYTGTGSAASATSLDIQFVGNNPNISGTAANLHFKVRDQAGTALFDYNASYKAGDVVSLGASIGLSVSFTAGTAVKNDAAATAVSRTTPTDVAPTAAFNASDVNLRPRFEGGAQVSAGAFTVNGASISVAASDSINAVLAKINGSSAGVTATFSGDRVTLTTNAASEQAIALGSDTSGFLSALKLSGATTARGNVHDDRDIFAASSKLGSVQTGSFSVNGTSISVNRSTDSLSSVLARVNASGAGVTASYDAVTDKVSFSPNVAGASLVLDGDTSGLLSALHVSPGARGTAARADSPFNGAGLSDPLLDPGFAVTAGSFTVNGVAIAVAANDTINGVLGKINASAAGVTATVSGDRVTLASRASSEGDIVLAGDTSGFLAATKLAGAATTHGNVHDEVETFAQSGRLGSVQTGSFAVNGTTIAVNRNTDTLASVLSRVNAAGAGVTASYDAGTDRVSFTPTTPGASLLLDDDTSGLLAALQVASGATGTAVRADARFDGTGLSDPLFDGGLRVTAGSFSVNGVRIDVSASDTVNGVVDRINASSAGVTATFSADRLKLATTGASEQAITVGDDTSGFLQALKLGSATTTRGNVHDDVETFARSAAFGSVTTGSFSVNGTAISIDRDADSLASVLARINDAGAGVAATYDRGSDRVVLTPDTPGATLVVDGDTSGFLAAAKLPAGARGTAVRPDARFDGSGLFDPLFDPGVRVTAGSFLLNGVRIDVAADDTLSGVLAKIEGSSAGVHATFDAGTQRVTLTTKDPSATAIAAREDTSGFLAAVKLDAGAVSTPGLLPSSPVDSALATVLPGVGAGVLAINGRSWTIDPSTQTLRDVVGEISRSGVVRATLDESTGRVSINALRPGETLAISDTSGLSGALGIRTGLTRPAPAEARTVTTPGSPARIDDPAAAAQLVGDAIDRLDEALGALSRGPREVGALRRDAEDAARSSVSGIGEGAAAAFRIDTTSGATQIVVDRVRLTDALRADPAALGGFLDAALGAALGKALDRHDTAQIAAEMRAAAEFAKHPTAGLDLPPVELFATELARSVFSSLFVPADPGPASAPGAAAAAPPDGVAGTRGSRDLHARPAAAGAPGGRPDGPSSPVDPTASRSPIAWRWPPEPGQDRAPTGPGFVASPAPKSPAVRALAVAAFTAWDPQARGTRKPE